MTVRELIQQALDPFQPEGIQLAAARKVSDFCRHRLGMNYDQTFALVHEVDSAVTLPRWESLMYECDREENQG